MLHYDRLPSPGGRAALGPGVAHNLAALLEAHRPDAHLGYWHEQGRQEVDFVIELGREAAAIEIKAATRWSEGDLLGAYPHRLGEKA